MENDPLARLRLFPGSVSDQVIALTDLWKSRSKRTFVALRERMNELDDLEPKLEPAAFDNYFRRTNREKTPEEVVWAIIRIMRDDMWLPKDQQCTLKEALYLAALKNVSVVTYARIYQLFPGQEVEFKELCPLGDFIAEMSDQSQPKNVLPTHTSEEAITQQNNTQSTLAEAKPSLFHSIKQLPGKLWGNRWVRLTVMVLAASCVLWTFISMVGPAH